MTDDKIAEIRARHSRDDRWRYSPSPQMHDDRAALLAEVDRQRAEIEQLRAGIQSLAESLRASLDAAIRQRDEARAENERLRAEIKRLRAKIKWLIEDDERLHYVLYRIANPPPFADCPVEMAQNATRGEHLRREAFDGIRRALEGKP